MEYKRTQRGFVCGKFSDRNGEKCSLQKSSIATEDAIWLGIDDADPKMFIPYGNPSWRPLPLPTLPEGGHFSFTTRMHLTRDGVKALLPALTHFVKTGELPAPPGEQERVWPDEYAPMATTDPAELSTCDDFPECGHRLRHRDYCQRD